MSSTPSPNTNDFALFHDCLNIQKNIHMIENIEDFCKYAAQNGLNCIDLSNQHYGFDSAVNVVGTPSSAPTAAVTLTLTDIQCGHWATDVSSNCALLEEHCSNINGIDMSPCAAPGPASSSTSSSSTGVSTGVLE